MRNDRLFSAMPEVRTPTSEEVRWHMQQSARMRSEEVHELLHRAAVRIGGAFHELGRALEYRGTKVRHAPAA
jgi:hypothetical protein